MAPAAQAQTTAQRFNARLSIEWIAASNRSWFWLRGIGFNARLSIEWIAAQSFGASEVPSFGFNARLSIEWIAASCARCCAESFKIQCPLEHRVDCCKDKSEAGRRGDVIQCPLEHRVDCCYLLVPNSPIPKGWIQCPLEHRVDCSADPFAAMATAAV